MAHHLHAHGEGSLDGRGYHAANGRHLMTHVVVVDHHRGTSPNTSEYIDHLDELAYREYK